MLKDISACLLVTVAFASLFVWGVVVVTALVWFLLFLLACVLFALLDAWHSRWAMLQALKETRLMMELEAKRPPTE
jgi:hypothetical protein